MLKKHVVPQFYVRGLLGLVCSLGHSVVALDGAQVQVALARGVVARVVGAVAVGGAGSAHGGQAHLVAVAGGVDGGSAVWMRGKERVKGGQKREINRGKSMRAATHF